VTGASRPVTPSRPVPAIQAALDGERPATARPRFAQLTYTSFHRAGGVGGRQVKEVSGDLTPEEQQPLAMRAVGPDTGKLDQFLTPDEVDRLPRRLVYGAPWEGAAAYWHSVPAGIDSSGRPGNVFAHILLDRRPAEPAPPLRPSDLLRSPWWLRPFGDEEVRLAGLAAVPEPPWPADEAHGRAAVLDFLAERGVVKVGVLSGLLDAVFAAMQHGPMVVLGVEDVASAEMWVAAVCHLMSPGTSRQLYFSTTERATGVAAARAAGLHLVVVPCADLAQLAPDDSVVLLSDEDLAVEFVEYDEDDDDQEHETRYRSRIPVTPWSAIAAAVVRERQLTADLLALQDEVAAEAGDDALPCGWPLAMAIVLRTLVQHEEPALDYAAPAAAALIAQEPPPPGVRRGTRLHRADHLVRQRSLGQTTAEAWAVVAGPRRRGDDRTSAVNTYLERALRDAEWLCQADRVPVPRVVAGELDADVVTQARVALGRLAAPSADLGRDPDARMSEAVRALRLLDLAVRSGLVDGRADAELVDAALAAGPGPLLLDPATAAALVDRVGPLAETTQSRVVRPWFDARLPDLPGRPGCRLPTALLRWLFPEPPAPISPSGLAQAGSQPATLVEAVLAATAVLADPSAFRAFAVAATLATPSGGLDRLAQGPALAVADVQGLLDVVEPHQLVPVLAPPLLTAPADPGLDAVVARVRADADRPEWDTPGGQRVQDAAELRQLETGWSRVREGHDRWRTASRFAALLRAAQQAWPLVLPDALVESGMAADVVDRVLRTTEPDGPLLATQRPNRSARDDEARMLRVAGRIVEAVDHGVVPDIDIVLAAQMTIYDDELRQMGRPWWQDLADVWWAAPNGQSVLLLDHVMRLRVKTLWSERRQAALVDDVRQRVHHAASQHSADPRRLTQAYDAAAVRWWRMVGVKDDALGALNKRWW
jgi:GTPase-associated protein 1, N-terminal domain type 2/GTPase-associated protein 1, middle domain